MATVNPITKNYSVNAAILGEPLLIPEDCVHDISLILRVILAISDSDTLSLIRHGEPYEILIRRLQFYQQNLQDVASRIREVTKCY